MSGGAVHRVHCFECSSSYEQTGPHPHVCGLCGSRRIGVHSDSTGPVWAVTLMDGGEGLEQHAIEQSAIGELVQAIVNAGITSEQAVVVTPPEAADATGRAAEPTRERVGDAH